MKPAAGKKAILEVSKRRIKSTSSKKLLLSVEVNELSSLFVASVAGADIIYIPISRFEALMAPENAEKLEDLKARKN